MPSPISIAITAVILVIAGALFMWMPMPTHSCQEAYTEPLHCQPGEYVSNGICCPKNQTNVNEACVAV